MPIFFLPVILALTSVSADRVILPQPAAASPRAESATFDPAKPPSWWLTKMQRPCAPTGNRVSC